MTKNKKILLCLLSSTLFLNSCSAPVYALEGNKFYITNDGIEGLSDSFINDSVLEEEVSPYVAPVVIGGTLVLMTVIAGCYTDMTPGELQNISFNVWDMLPLNVRSYLSAVASESEQKELLELRKDMVQEIINSVNSYVGENEGTPIYDSVINGLPVKEFTKLDFFTNYSKALVNYEIGSSFTINNKHELGATVSEEGKLMMLLNGAVVPLSSTVVVDEEKNLTLTFSDNRMNSIRPSVGSEVFYVQYIDTTRGKEGFALCYTTKDAVRVYGRAELNVEPFTTTLNPPKDAIDNKDALLGSGTVTIPKPGTVDDIISGSTVNNPTITDTETGTSINKPNGGSGGSSGKINFAPLFALGEGLKNVFPFCLPFDLLNIFETLDAEPLTPVFEVDFSFMPWYEEGEVVMVADFSMFNGLMKLVRLVEYIGFCIFLIVMTRKVI